MVVAESGGEGHHAERAGKRRKGGRFLEKLTCFVLLGFFRCVWFPMAVEQHGARVLAPLGQSTSASPGAGV